MSAPGGRADRWPGGSVRRRRRRRSLTPLLTHGSTSGLPFGRAYLTIAIGIHFGMAGKRTGDEFIAGHRTIAVGVDGAGTSGHRPSRAAYRASAFTTPAAMMATTVAAAAMLAAFADGTAHPLSHGGMTLIPFGARDAAIAIAIHALEHFGMAAFTRGSAIFRGQPAIIVAVHPGKGGFGGGAHLGSADRAIAIGIGALAALRRILRVRGTRRSQRRNRQDEGLVVHRNLHRRPPIKPAGRDAAMLRNCPQTMSATGKIVANMSRSRIRRRFGRREIGAGKGNRTPLASLEG